MALIKEIRQRTGLAIGVIAVGLIFFLVGGDLLGPNSMLLGSSRTTVGEIAGEDISYEEYVQKIEQTKLSFQQNTGRNPSENELSSIRDQAWQALIVEKIFAQQYEELGLKVSDEELVDMVQGKNIIGELRRQLTNPETGEFDRSQLITFLQSLETADPQQQMFWAQQEQLFADSRLRIKYDNMLATSEYATTVEAKMQHKMANTIADVSHIQIPYYAVSDSVVSLSEGEIKSYINENQDKYKVEESRSIKYVRFPLQPSAEDSATTLETIQSLTVELKETPSDSAFVIRNSEAANPFITVYPGDPLPVNFTNNVDNPEVGVVYGPFLSNNSSYVSYKISDSYEGAARMRASHILLSTEGMDEDGKAQVKARAQEVLDEVNETGNFEVAAAQYGQDGTAQRGGDLGWFFKDNFVTEFADAVFATKSLGVINKLVETEYGYHIIKVTELPETKHQKIAVLELELIASDITRNDIFRNADFFAANSDDAASFEENASTENYQVLAANNVGANARTLNNMTSAREIVRWAFNDASIGKVSTVFELDDAYVVALLTGKTEEGEGTIENPEIRAQATIALRNEKKAEIIKEKIKGLETLEAIKEVYPDASIGTTPDLKMNASVLPGIGFAPKAIGAVFGLQNSGDITQPISEDIGVIVAKLNSLIPATEIADYTRYQNEITASASQRTAYMIMMAMEELAGVKDYRYKFF
ncbi:SurA N-terminal domain-containing protein [Cyclobacterium marinum]|uniref:SurA N-terminal domain-containing protein n=1 Tax=Cyclobacterium marinum TaxID=104 RepID=UPI0011ECC321|nr:SurA N-terminal domain-containing protein [Cyclobacterium marinum]MBI0401641.1 SurA N-terminal domain-containing protein [Cyclobacterium marinum]